MTADISLNQFKQKVADQAPGFAQALEQENAHLAFCKETRESLKRLRDDLSILQTDLAARMQMTQPAVSKIENGEGDLGLVTISRYAGALGLRPTITFVPIAGAAEGTPRDQTAQEADAIAAFRDLALGAAMRAELEALEAGTAQWAAAQDLLRDRWMMEKLVPTVTRSILDSFIAGQEYAVAKSPLEAESPERDILTEGRRHGSAG